MLRSISKALVGYILKYLIPSIPFTPLGHLDRRNRASLKLLRDLYSARNQYMIKCTENVSNLLCHMFMHLQKAQELHPEQKLAAITVV